MVGAVISVAVAETGKAGDFAVMFQSGLYNESERIIEISSWFRTKRRAAHC
jgi:hypothetical protein